MTQAAHPFAALFLLTRCVPLLTLTLTAVFTLRSNSAVLSGFPPKPLTETGSLMSGDLITVEEDAAAAAEEEEHEPVEEAKAGEQKQQKIELPSVPCLDGQLVRRVIDADNSCLFNAVGYVLQQRNRKAATDLRKVVAEAVAADPEIYSEGFLGRSNADYCEWILKPDSWGGAIEVSVLVKHFGVEIAIVDISNTRLDRFGEDAGHSERTLVLYDGIHYDALALSPAEGADEEFDRTVFNSRDEGEILEAALKLAQTAKEKMLFTDTSKFQLRCLVCQQGLTGEKDALKHATETGHQNFAEYTECPPV